MALDDRDVLIMMPAVRRSLDPGTASAVAASGYSDDMISAITADAAAELLAIAGPEAFPFIVSASATDPTSGYPTAWQIDPAPPMEIQALIVIQAALGQVWTKLRDLVTSEKISNQGGSWEIQKSAQVMSGQVKELRDARDMALRNAVRIVPPLDAFIDMIAVRNPTIATDVEVTS